MFDGNFRSSRREVNLSGNRRRGGRTTTGSSSSSVTSRSRNNNNNRNEILRTAEIQRKQRQEATRRDKAARVLQKWTRGVLSRIQVVNDLSGRIGCSSPAQKNMAATSLCLSFPSRFLKETSLRTSRKALLLKYQHTCSEKGGGSSDGVMDSDDEMLDVESSDWFSQLRILKCTLEDLDPNDPKETTADLLKLLQSIWGTTTNVDDGLFLTLAQTCQRWYLQSNKSQSSQLPPDEVSLQTLESIMKWAISESEDPENSQRTALLATIVLSGPLDVARSYTASGSGSPDETQFETKWFGPLVDAITILDRTSPPQGQDNTQSNSDTIVLKAISDNLQNGVEQRLLSNLLDMTKSPRLIIVLRHVLSQPENSGLKVAASLLVRGETLDGVNIEKDIPEESNHDQYAVSDDMDGDDDEDNTSGTQQKDESSRPSDSKKARGSTSYYSRKDLLTLGKLDDMYHERIQQAKKENVTLFDGQVKLVATKIVKAPWVDWGVDLLTQSDTEGGASELSSQYIETIGYLMQASSDLRPKMKLSVLSPVAFSKTIMDAIWLGVKNDRFQDRYLGQTLFADLFSHYLMPLSDLDFLRLHVGRPEDMNEGILILASEVVAFYKDALYEVYWTKPVLADDVEVDNPKGRLILSGTKLFNILYERWDRLQHVFCSEDQWWFPHLSSIGNDRAVVSVAERMDEGDDNASVDSDSDDDSDYEMAVDGQNQRSRPNDDTAKAEAESDALAGFFRDPKMARVLTSIPQALPFERRLKLFNSLIRNDKQKALQAAASRRAMMAMAGQRDDDPMAFFDGGARERVTIRRADLYADSMEKLNGLGARLKNQIQVTFVNQHGTEEAGIDGGGVFKEFLDDLIKDAFSPVPPTNADDDGNTNAVKTGPQLFVETPVQTLTVNLSLTSHDLRTLAHYSFLGRVLGKAVYESILVEPQFALPFLNQCLGKTNSLEDLKNYDEEYYVNLNKLRRFSQAELELSGLTFELTFGGNGAKPRTVELEPGGRSKAVTKKNAFKYTNLVANELLNKQGAEQTKAFLRGFRDLIPVSWVRLFSCTELQKLISGDDAVRGIDVAGLRKSVSYLGGYHESQPYMQAFWDVLENDFTPEQQRKFLRFMTSCSRQPLLGFSSLEPNPSIQQIRLREEDRTKNSRLPTSQTCMNILKLPNYDDRDLLKEKLLAAV
eukprot:CAMPEP_0113504138 /NCGR_PEP_ID=MMETSP0014_2-20120614/34557_1 /TAXON_ID=2857 /ORGANISM="Nitzschia sp." /LENGTH=1177 /DNA_ID=CAMNT_0000399231 /DNA_START=113 /DNA_END=3643 /DNA_ORIENTATION=- /assembly_acc=CAM_ASM_000159